MYVKRIDREEDSENQKRNFTERKAKEKRNEKEEEVMVGPCAQDARGEGRCNRACERKEKLTRA